ncbi:hypothetical protein Droror1_Dr00004789 [Drosera rotundifolia]
MASAGDESSPPPSSSSPPRTTTESSQSAPPSPSAAVYTLCTEQPLDGPDPESHHLRILSSILGRATWGYSCCRWQKTSCTWIEGEKPLRLMWCLFYLYFDVQDPAREQLARLVLDRANKSDQTVKFSAPSALTRLVLDSANKLDQTVESSAPSAPVTETIYDPVASKLAAVHHVSQAIKSHRWTRQLQEIDPEIRDDDGSEPQLIYELLSLCMWRH